MDRLKSSSFLQYLNPAAQKDQFFKSLAEGLDEELQKYLDKIHVNIIISSLDQQPEYVLDAVGLYHFGADGYDLTLPYGSKLELCKKAIVNKISKGTPSAIKQILPLCFDHVDLIEWFDDDPVGPPYTFRVKVADALVDPAQTRKMIQLILKLKNVRSWFAGLFSLDLIPAPPPGDASFFMSGNVGRYDYQILPYKQTVK
jgi:phage tail P2-like protein